MIGKIIGNYKITAELARGGMGTVYHGHHLHLPREIAVKSILLTAYSPSAQQHLKARFLREAFVQSQLDHPNIVRIYEFFVEDDNYYLVMEFVQGMSLKNLISRKGPPTPAQAVYLCKQALEGIEYAHNFSYVDENDDPRVGIIHRDIKPANLLLDTKGRLKITDFGIVKVTSDEGLTQSGFQPGTVEYMSPEQLLGLNVDERTDIYCLGVTFYEMLTGRLPFPRSATGSDWDVRKGHIEVEAPSIINLRPDIHPVLAAIIMRTLRKEPGERFQSASEFIQALREYEDHYLPGGQYRRSGSATSAAPAATGHLARPESALSNLIDYSSSMEQTEIWPQPSESSEYSVEESITIPIAPSSLKPDSAPTIKPFAPSGALRAPEMGGADSNPTNREVFISIPAASQNRKWPLALAATGALIICAAGGAYLFSGHRENTRALTSVSTRMEPEISSPAPTTPALEHSKSAPPPSSIAPVVDHSALKQARVFEQQERYSEAIGKYEEYLRRNPTAGDAQAVSEKLVSLRQVDGFIKVAYDAMEIGRYGIARQNFVSALNLRPDSNRAKAGLAEAKNRMSDKRFRPLRNPNARPNTSPITTPVSPRTDDRILPDERWPQRRRRKILN